RSASARSHTLSSRAMAGRGARAMTAVARDDGHGAREGVRSSRRGASGRAEAGGGRGARRLRAPRLRGAARRREAARRPEARGRARGAGRRAAELSAFVSALRATSPGELVRCAWCDRVAAGEYWIDPYPLLGANLRERLRKSASHGVCPDCFERVTSESERQRAQRPPLVKKL